MRSDTQHETISTLHESLVLQLDFTDDGLFTPEGELHGSGRGIERVVLEDPRQEPPLQHGAQGVAAGFRGGVLHPIIPISAPTDLQQTGWSLCLRVCLPETARASARRDQVLLSIGDAHDAEIMKLELQARSTDRDYVFSMKTREGCFPVWAPLALLRDAEWHDLIFRYTGNRLDFYADGRLVHHFGSVSGALPLEGDLQLNLGGPGNGSQTALHFEGLVEHLLVWHRAIEDEEIIGLSGGPERVIRRGEEIARRLEESLCDYQDKAALDPLRPRAHFLPAACWMNDPNGLIQVNGDYHLFYQYNPHGAYWGTMHWGHGVSRDLVTWRHLPVALAPEVGSPDRDGCFSGCTVLDNGTPTVLYTGVFPETQCLATGTPDLVHWKKDDGNPIIAAPPAGMQVTGFRDPWVWREGEEWLMLLGSGIEGEGGTVLLYRSRDLRHWEYLHPLCTGEAKDSGTVWECPNFFPLGDKWVLIVSPIPFGNVMYFIGTYANRRFRPERSGLVDYGRSFYAPQSFADEQGRRIMFGWLREERPDRQQMAAGWSGAQSLPLELSLTPDGDLAVAPAAEVERLRHQLLTSATELSLTAAEHTLELPQTRQIELEAELAATQGTLVIRIEHNLQGQQATALTVDAAAGQVRVDRSASTTTPEVCTEPLVCPLSAGADGRVRLRIFIDRSIMEIHVNGRHACIARLYPSQNDGQRIQLSAQGATQIDDLRVWSLRNAFSG